MVSRSPIAKGDTRPSPFECKSFSFVLSFTTRSPCDHARHGTHCTPHSTQPLRHGTHCALRTRVYLFTRDCLTTHCALCDACLDRQLPDTRRALRATYGQIMTPPVALCRTFAGRPLSWYGLEHARIAVCELRDVARITGSTNVIAFLKIGAAATGPT